MSDWMGADSDFEVVNVFADDAAWIAERVLNARLYVEECERRKEDRRQLTPLMAGLSVVTIGLLTAAFWPL